MEPRSDRVSPDYQSWQGFEIVKDDRFWTTALTCEPRRSVPVVGLFVLPFTLWAASEWWECLAGVAAIVAIVFYVYLRKENGTSQEIGPDPPADT